MNTIKRQYKSTFGEGNFSIMINDSGQIRVDANSPDVGPLIMSTGTKVYFSCFFVVKRNEDNTLEIIGTEGSVPPYFRAGIMNDKNVAPSFRRKILEAARFAAERYISEHAEDWYNILIDNCEYQQKLHKARIYKLRQEIKELNENIKDISKSRRSLQNAIIKTKEVSH